MDRGRMSWATVKKRLKSKTYAAATFMMSVGVVMDGYTPEIKQAISESVGLSWGIIYAVVFMLVMNALREVTNQSLKDKE